MLHKSFSISPIANPAAVVGGQGCNYRFTVIADGLLRYEWAADGVFEDRASTFAIRREQPVPSFRVIDRDHKLEIVTDRLHMVYDKERFSASGLSAQIRSNTTEWGSIWRYGVGPMDLNDSYDLFGTARTLDLADGRIPLGPGVISRRGYAVLDDSSTMLFEPDGWVAPRPSGDRVDGYLFAYGHDYRAAIRAFYAISGNQPLLPRWALGNWWSRYYPYKAEEYLALMDRFRAEGVPLSVGVIDMDWHVVDVDPVHGSGWTGYSWNSQLFPDPVAFLAGLHDRGLKTTLNVHPADGVRSYEDSYLEIAQALGHDVSSGDPISFDATDQKFLDVYFNILHRRLEDQGVDFWWIDWQQGPYSRTSGIDPLWMLNHFHFLDNARDGRRPLTFSRFAGPGSHRYPVGFSGDTVVTWASLDFQSEFTATASNIGYGWWSHDIGGHMFGGKDDELATRWVQLGVFSPILRLHSSNNPFNTKEPWSFGKEAHENMIEALRLRHRLMPYIYTMNVRAACNGEPLVQPIYWDHPKRNEAYSNRNEFLFGSQLIVVPITTPRDPQTRLGGVLAWLPPGRHVDVLTGAVYDGDRHLWLHRPLNGVPVLASLGAIVPLDAATEPRNGGRNPEALEVIIVVGADGTFELLEDDDTGAVVDDVRFSRTPIVFSQQSGIIRIGPTSPVIPEAPITREWTLKFPALPKPKDVRLLIDGEERVAETKYIDSYGTVVQLGPIPLGAECTVNIGTEPELVPPEPATRIYPILNDAQISFDLKLSLWNVVSSDRPLTAKIGQLHTLGLDPVLLNALLEYLVATHF
ncbi:glycosyl hydrolases family 31-domain-containing protein [Lipomyces kononenkoae]|uniref:Glycosyl hydrolases family 31-domain-containing protein n=1 Tax=Lipomyces kononenkoae TaxID=34357 RepID=A0ACC3SXY8_LIPKO